MESGGAAPDQVDVRIGRSLRGQWRIDALLDVETTARVYAATDGQGRRVVVKVLDPEIARDDDACESFLKGPVDGRQVLHRDVSDEGEPFLVLTLLASDDVELHDSQRLRLAAELAVHEKTGPIPSPLRPPPTSRRRKDLSGPPPAAALDEPFIVAHDSDAPPGSRHGRPSSLPYIPPPPALPLPRIPSRKPDVRGTLATSPVPHLLVHILSRGLTGSLIVRGPDGAGHAVQFVAGNAVRLRPSDTCEAPLGKLLVAHGAVDREVIDTAIVQARAKGQLLGKQLVDDLTIEPAMLMTVLRAQIDARLGVIAATPDTGSYEFFVDEDLLGGFGGDEPIPGDPLATLHAVVRAFHDEARLDATLDRLGDRPIILHSACDPSRFDLTEGEVAVLDAAREFELSYPSLVDAEIERPAVVRALIYTLAITRHLELGTSDHWPIGVPRTRVVARTEASAGPGSHAPTSSETFRPSLIPQMTMAPRARTSSITQVEAIPESRPDPGLAQRREDIVARAAIVADLDHYAVLDVARDASPDDLQIAFVRAAKAYHPDRLPLELGDLRSDASTIFARIGDAHRVLADPLARVAYDERLARGDQPAVANATSTSTSAAYRAVTEAEESKQVERVLAAATDYHKAEVMMRHGDLAAAERFASSAVERDPESSSYLALLGWIRAQRTTELARLVDPLRTLDLAVRRDPDNDRAIYYRGVVYKRLGRAPEAIRDFRAAAKLNPRNVDAVREVRLHTMRTSGGKAPDKQEPERKGLRGLFRK